MGDLTVAHLDPQGPGIPLPEATPVSSPFWEACGRGELTFQRCEACGTPTHPPTVLCRRCRSQRLQWEVAAGTATLYSWTVVWRPQTPAFVVPYAPAIVRLDEGVDLLSNLIGCDVDELVSGMPLAVEFHAIGDGITLPYFRAVA